MEVYVDDEAKLTLHGLQQHYVKLKENEKNKKLFELLDVLEFNQVFNFLNSNSSTFNTKKKMCSTTKHFIFYIFILDYNVLGRHFCKISTKVCSPCTTPHRTKFPCYWNT